MNKFKLTITPFLIFLTMTVFNLSAEAQKKEIVWTRDADIPLARGGYFAEWYSGGLWLAGGSYWKDGKKLWTNETSFYNPKTKTWSTLSPIPKAIGYGITAKIGKDLYILGGADGDGNFNSDIYRWRDGNWGKVGESPTGFVFSAYSAVGSKIYVFGGSPSAADIAQSTNETLIYETKTNKWKKADPIPGKTRQIFSANKIGKNIYIFGGVRQEKGQPIKNLDDAYKFDTQTETWMPIKKMPVAMRAFWAGSDGENIYLIGGYNEAGLETVYRYSPSKNDYETVSKLPQPLMDTKFIFHKGKFYGASGEDKPMSRFAGLIIGELK